MTKRATKAKAKALDTVPLNENEVMPTKKATKKPDFVIKVGFRYLGALNILVPKDKALPFDSRDKALAHATNVFHDPNEHKYRVVPA